MFSRKRLILLAGLLAAVLLGAAAILASVLQPEKLRVLLDSELEARLGRPVELGEVRLSLIPPGARVRGMRVGTPGGGPDLLRARRLSVSVEFWPLLRGEVRLAKLSVRKPEIHLARDREGRLNIDDLLGRAPKEAPPGAPAAPGRRPDAGVPAPGPPRPPRPPRPPGGVDALPLFFVRELALSDGTVVFEDRLRPERSLRLGSVNGSLRGGSPAGPFRVALSARLASPPQTPPPRARAARLQVEAEVEPRAGSFPLVRGDLSLESLPVEAARHWLPGGNFFLSGGNASLLARLRFDGKSLGGEGGLTLRGSRLRAGTRLGAELPPTTFSFQGEIGREGFSLSPWSLESGNQVRARGSLRHAWRGGQPRWSLGLEELTAQLPEGIAPLPTGLLPAKVEVLARGELKGALELRKAAIEWEGPWPGSPALGEKWRGSFSGALRLRVRELSGEGVPFAPLLRGQELELESEGEVSPGAWRCLRCRAGIAGFLSLKGSLAREASPPGATWRLSLGGGEVDLGKLRAHLPPQALPLPLRELIAGGPERGVVHIRELEASVREDDPAAFLHGEAPLPWRGSLLLAGISYRVEGSPPLQQVEPLEVRLRPSGVEFSGGLFRLGNLRLAPVKGSWKAGREGGFEVKLGFEGPLGELRSAFLHPSLPEEFRAYIRPTSAATGEAAGEINLILPAEKKAPPRTGGALRLREANLRLRPGLPPVAGASGEIRWDEKQLSIRELRGRLGASRVETLSLHLPLLADRTPWALSLRGDLTLPDLRAVLLAPEWPGRVREWAARIEEPEGGLRLQLQASGGRELKVEGAAEAAGLSFRLQGHEEFLRIPSGSASLRAGTLRMDGLRLFWGENEATLSGEVSQALSKGRKGSLRARGSVPAAALMELAQRAGVSGLGGGGRVGFEGEAHFRDGGGSARAEVDLTPARYSYLTFLRKRPGMEQRVSFAGSWREDGSWELSRLALTLGRSQLSAEGLLRLGREVGADLDLRGGIHLRDLTSLLLLRELASAGGEVDLRLRARGNSASDLALEGEVELRGVRARSLLLANPLNELSGRARLGPSDIALEGIRLRLPGFSADLAGVFRGFGERATLDRLRTAAGHLYRLLPGLESRRLEERAQREDALRVLYGSELTGRFTHRAGRFLRWGYSGLAGEFSLQRGVLHLRTLQADAYGGRVRASGWMNAMEVKSRPVSLRFEAEGVDLDAFLRDAGAREHEVTGKLSARGELRSGYPSFEEFRKRLAGHISFRAREGSINRLVALSKVLTFLDLQSIFKGKLSALARRGIPYEALGADFEIKDGVARTENFLIDGPAMKVSAAGEVDLARGRYDLKVALAPLRAVDALVSRVPLLGWVLTGENKTLLVSTYEVKGPWEDPEVRPIHLRSLGQGALGVLERALQLPGRVLGGR